MCSITFITNLLGEIRGVKVTALLANVSCVGTDGIRILRTYVNTDK